MELEQVPLYFMQSLNDVYLHFKIPIFFSQFVDLFPSFPANTAFVYHHGKLMALSEADKPCKLSVC
jgi:hypothetical protein